MLRRPVADQIYRGFGHLRQIGRLPMTVNVHVKDTGTLKEEMVVKRRDVEAVFDQRDDC